MEPVRYPYYYPIGGAITPGNDIDITKIRDNYLTFVPIGSNHYECLDCKRANYDWDGKEEDFCDHARMHVAMISWVKSRHKD